MTPFLLLKLALATWWIAYAVTATDGPGGVFWYMRENWKHGRRAVRIEREGQVVTRQIHGLLDCIICLAPWVAALLMLAALVFKVEAIVDLFAVAGAAILLHGYTGWRHATN